LNSLPTICLFGFVLVSAYIGLERWDLAEEIVAEVKRMNPAFSLARFASAQPYRDAGLLEKLVSDLWSAGLAN
jgi:hypothetical protein